MSERYPKIRVRSQEGTLLVREGLSFIFYMRHPQEVVAPGAMRSLEAYLRAVGPQAMGWYADEEGESQKLDDAGWERIHREMRAERWAHVHLDGANLSDLHYRFEYHGRRLVDLLGRDDPDQVSTLSCWLPSEFLDEHGPSRVRELALELAAPLPFCSGYAGLSFNGELDLMGVTRQVTKHCFRYPGLDISAPRWKLGTQIQGAQWLTFLGQPVLGELGGTAGLRARLHEPGTAVQELDGERAVITLGPWPEAGDTEQGRQLPAYRELARLLEPWLYHEGIVDPEFPPEQKRRWVRRFLD